jgi:2-polyprenyl-6-methoxyphenol hydroxylase-like FAD-dependent oxidoreductase
MTAETRRALVVGGGIAGPVLGMFLRRAGVEATVFEARPAPQDEAGAFLNLAPNGRAVLAELGIAGEVDAAGTPTTGIEFVNHRGKRLGRNPEQLLLIKRGALNRVLREQAVERGVSVEFAKRLVGLHDDGGSVTARFADGGEATGHVLVGCDGIHSATRRAILSDGPAPVYTGLVGTGGFVRLPEGPEPSPVMEMTFGLRAFFGYQVTPSGEIFWFQNTPEPTDPTGLQAGGLGGDDQRWKTRLVQLHRDDHEPIPTMLQAAAPHGIGRFPIYDLATLPTWHTGRVALAGDAAHVMGPHTGQGSAMALEDAMVLAQCLRDIPDVETALANYEHRRRPRVERVVKLTRRVGNTKTPGPFGRAVRDRVLPVVLPLGVKQTAKLYAHHIDWDETLTTTV